MKSKKNPNENLEQYSRVFTLLGLVLSLFIAYQFIEHKSYASNKPILHTSFKPQEPEEEKVINFTHIKEKPKQVEAPIVTDKLIEEPKTKADVLDPNHVTKVDDFLIIKEAPIATTDNEPLETLTGEDIEHSEEFEEKGPETIDFIAVENIPVYPGCEKYKYDKLKSKKCFNKKIKKFFGKKFDPSIANDLNLTGLQKITSQFVIGSDGRITTDIKTRSAHPELSKQVEDILKELPKMAPAKQNGKSVNMIYTLPVKFLVQ